MAEKIEIQIRYAIELYNVDVRQSRSTIVGSMIDLASTAILIQQCGRLDYFYVCMRYLETGNKYWRRAEMFREISQAMKERMAFLETIDRRDRADGTEKLKRLRQVPPETGKLLAILASYCPLGEYVEIGTSAGYSAMWLSLALKPRGIKLKTYEILPDKIDLAKETFHLAGIADTIELVEGDFCTMGPNLKNIAFCFLDCEKHLYEKCFDILADKFICGGLLVADNAINLFESIKPMIEKAQNDERFDCLTVPIGNGEFLCRRNECKPKSEKTNGK